MICGNGGGYLKKTSSFGSREKNKAVGSYQSPLLGMSTVQAVVLSKCDSNIPTALVLQHDLDCCYHLHSPEAGSLAQCPLDK